MHGGYNNSLRRPGTTTYDVFRSRAIFVHLCGLDNVLHENREIQIISHTPMNPYLLRRESHQRQIPRFG